MALRELLATFGISVDESEVVHAEHSLEHLVHSVETVGKYALASFVGHEIKEFFEGTIEGARALAREATMFGIPAQELQGLQYAANRSGVAVESLNFGIRFLQRSMFNASEDGGKMAAQLKKAGVETKNADGSFRPVADVLGDLADHFHDTEDPVQRTGLAMKLFGRGGAAMIPMLSKGGDALRAYAAEVKELGGGYTEEFLEQSKEVAAEHKKLAMQWTSLKVALVSELIPAAHVFESALFNIRQTLLNLNKEVNLGKLLLVGMFGLVVSKLPVAIGMLTKFVMTSGALVAKWALLWLVADDLFGLFTDEDSEIGAILDKVFGEGAAEEFIASVKDMFGSWEAFRDGLYLGVNELALLFETAWVNIKHAALEVFASLRDAWDSLISSLHLPDWASSWLGAEKRGPFEASHREEANADSARENLAIAEKMQNLATEWRDRKATRQIVADREAQLAMSLPQATAGSNTHIEDHSVINVQTLPATTATQAREVGRAAAKAKGAIGEGRRTLNATEHAPE